MLFYYFHVWSILDDASYTVGKYVRIVQYVATYFCSYVALALVFLFRYLLIASWLPKAAQLPKAAHINWVCEQAPRRKFEI